MSIRSNVFRSLISTFLILTLAAISFADTIRLKDGSILKGHIISFSSGKFVILIGEGSRSRQMTFMANEIESIQFDSPSEKPAVANNNTNSGVRVINTSTIDPPRVITTDNTRIKTDPPRVRDTTNENIKGIGWNVKVLADNTSNGWTNTGWVLKKGQKVRITGSGTISLGKGKMSPPSGVADLEDNQKLLKNVATGALIAVIGDDNNDFIYIGAEREFTATRDGSLFLGVNEGYLDDNSGSFDVKVEILSDSGN